MPLIRLFRLAMLATTASSALSGCVTTSQFPHVEPAAAVADARLSGTWLLSKGTERTWLHIGPGSPQGQSLLVVHQDTRPDREQGGMGGRILTAPAGKDPVASVALDWEFGEDGAPKAADKAQWLLLRYRLDGQSLQIERLDDDATGKAVQAGELLGQYQATGDGKHPAAPQLQTPTPKLAAWLASGKAKWHQWGVWTRR
jgi:hypothetical protein